MLRWLRFARRRTWQLRVAGWVVARARLAWSRLTLNDRQELRRLLVKSRGRRSRLTGAEKRRLRAIVRKARGRRARAA